MSIEITIYPNFLYIHTSERYNSADYMQNLMLILLFCATILTEGKRSLVFKLKYNLHLQHMIVCNYIMLYFNLCLRVLH